MKRRSPNKRSPVAAFLLLTLAGYLSPMPSQSKSKLPSLMENTLKCRDLKEFLTYKERVLDRVAELEKEKSLIEYAPSTTRTEPDPLARKYVLSKPFDVLGVEPKFFTFTYGLARGLFVHTDMSMEDVKEKVSRHARVKLKCESLDDAQSEACGAITPLEDLKDEYPDDPPYLSLIVVPGDEEARTMVGCFPWSDSAAQ